MTSASKQTQLEQQLNAQLEQANADLPESVKQDIASARMQALAQAKANQQAKGFKATFVPATFASVGVALAVVALVSYQQPPAIPAMPAELYATDMPSEDLALLEDLEFANWLLEQQEVLL